MKTLIVYYSYTGNNELLAKKLQSDLSCNIYRVVEEKQRNWLVILLDMIFQRTPAIRKDNQLKVADYDQLIFVAPVWAGKIASPLKSFLKQNAGAIKNYFFITLCGSGGNIALAAELNKLVDKRAASILELKINDLLPEGKKDKVKYTSGYRVAADDLKVFDKALKSFLEGVTGRPVVPDGGLDDSREKKASVGS